MTKQQIQQHFERHELLLHKLSHRCASRCGRPEDEVYGQACYEFVRAASSFDPRRKTSFPTYAVACVRNGLAQWGMKNDLPPDPETSPAGIAPAYDRPDRQLMRKEWLENLSEECREVAAIILNGPAEVLGLAQDTGRKVALGALRRYLREERGWAWPKIWTTIRSLKIEVARL